MFTRRFFSFLSFPFVGIPQRYARNRRVRRGGRKLIACTAIDPWLFRYVVRETDYCWRGKVIAPIDSPPLQTPTRLIFFDFSPNNFLPIKRHSIAELNSCYIVHLETAPRYFIKRIESQVFTRIDTTCMLCIGTLILEPEHRRSLNTIIFHRLELCFNIILL